jgi:hypothetical protein
MTSSKPAGAENGKGSRTSTADVVAGSWNSAPSSSVIFLWSLIAAWAGQPQSVRGAMRGHRGVHE